MLRRRSQRGVRRPARHGRHGRLGRSPVVRPPLPPLGGRQESFEIAIATVADYLRGTWPEMRDVEFLAGFMPAIDHPEGMPRWTIDQNHRTITLYRIPIERLLAPGHDDELHRRVAVEAAAFHAAAEYAGRDPWELPFFPPHHHH